jgi:hypothetical protein
LACGIAFCALAAASTAQAAFHTWRINELYTDATGNYQFVELHEAFNTNGQIFFLGNALTTQQGATTRVFSFPGNLPTSATANKSLLIGTPGFAALNVVTPDFIMQAPFLFPGGGTLNFAGVDSITYPALPVDGVKSIDRNGVVGTNSPTNLAGQTGTIGANALAPAGANVPTTGVVGLAMVVLAILGAGGFYFLRRAQT